MFVEDWLIVEGEVRLSPGALLPSTGLRVHGAPRSAGADDPDGIRESSSAGSETGDNRLLAYDVTGFAHDVRQVWAGPARSGRRSLHVGAEFVLDTGGVRFQVRFDGQVSDVPTGCRVTVTGHLHVVASYEWEAFDLTDTRTSWRVVDVVVSGPGDGAVIDVERR